MNGKQAGRQEGYGKIFYNFFAFLLAGKLSHNVLQYEGLKQATNFNVVLRQVELWACRIVKVLKLNGLNGLKTKPNKAI